MTRRRYLSVALTTVLSCLCTAGLAGPAAAANGGGGSGGNPPGGTPGYAAQVMSQVRVSGDHLPGYSINYTPPPCWLEPRFTSTQSWQRGDPSSYSSFSADADTYWWSFASNATNLLSILPHIPNARQQINSEFEKLQQAGGPDIWWVPAWLTEPQGLACARGLVSIMNQGFLDYLPPQHVTTSGTFINPQMLSYLARAALRLPHIIIHTNPAPGTRSDVNLPVWVWFTYSAAMQPRDRASVNVPGGGQLWAQITTSRPVVTLSVNAPASAYTMPGNCGATGSVYSGQAGAQPRCGVTFTAPSLSGPYTITATATWTVSWTLSTGGHGTFTSPPAQVTSSPLPVTVQEVQSVNGGNGGG